MKDDWSGAVIRARKLIHLLEFACNEKCYKEAVGITFDIDYEVYVLRGILYEMEHPTYPKGKPRRLVDRDDEDAE